MRLPTLKKILREDLSGAPDWVQGIIAPLNAFMEYVYQALNRNVSDADNIACQVKELIYTTPSTYPTMDNVEFQSTLKFKATGLQLLQIYERSTYTPPTSAVYVPWVEDSNGAIIIYPVIGLAASKTYVLRVRLS